MWEKSSPKFWALLVIKKSPNGRKMAQSGHSGTGKNFSSVEKGFNLLQNGRPGFFSLTDSDINGVFVRSAFVKCVKCCKNVNENNAPTTCL
jgi:hypothetical protein